jgi:subtilisin family serine protease
MNVASFDGDSLSGPLPGGRGRRRGSRAPKRRTTLAAALEALETRSMLAANVLDVAQVMWSGKLVEAVRNEYVLRMPQVNVATAKSLVDYQCRTPVVQRGWSLQTLGSGFFKLTAPGATQSTLTAWARSNGAQSVNVNAVRTIAKTPNDPLYGATENWAFPKISADKAWDVATGTSSTIVAVLDTGIDYLHPDLVANMWKNPNEIEGDGKDNDNNGWVDDIYGVNTIDGNGNPMDDEGHGTMCAGLIAAVGNNAVGISGVNWTAKVMAVKIFDAAGSTSLTAEIAGIQYVINQKIAGQNVVAANCSYGGYAFVQQEFDALNQLSQAGVLVVAAAGNDSNNNDTFPAYPASYTIPGLISVAASNTGDSLTGFSNYGVVSVDLAAPGENVLSTRSSLADPLNYVPYKGDTNYTVNSGTSFAAPLVAGAAGLLKSVKPSASIQQVKDAILGGVDKVPSLAGEVLTGGRLNVANAVTLINSTPGSTPVASIKSGQSLKFLEGNTGSTFADIKVVLDRPCDPGKSAAVWFSTQSGGSAFSGSDFIAQSGYVTFSGAETEKAIRIRIVGERTAESDEQFVVKLDQAQSKGATVGDGLATVTILDDDSTSNPGQPGGTDPLLPILSLAPKMQPAPGGGTGGTPGGMVPVPIREGGVATFVISLDRTSNKTISVRYSTLQPTLVPAGTALQGIDYVATSGTMTFRPGERTKEFTVSILADKVTDANETFRVVLTAPINAQLAGESGTVASAVTATIEEVGYVPPPAAGFQITVSFPDSSLTTAQKAVFQQAADRWQQIIVGDLPNVTDPATGQVIDDILIQATAPTIDGAGGILGQAGPTAMRQGSKGLPWKGIMEFDSADVAAMEADGTFKDVILHEMAHVLGFGTLWTNFGLLQGGGTSNPLYVGANALREYRSIFGVPSATGVPVENSGGPGTADGHWRESIFKTELMTGYASPAGTLMPISRVTVGQFQDLGYQVNYTRADTYTKPLVRAVVAVGRAGFAALEAARPEAGSAAGGSTGVRRLFAAVGGA